jgi:hypothetical protein
MKILEYAPAYLIGVLLVCAMIYAVGYYFNGSTPGRPLLHVFGGRQWSYRFHKYASFHPQATSGFSDSL